MPRYILRYPGRADAPTADLDRIRAFAGLTVVDTAPKMVLADATPAAAEKAAADLPGWVVAPERTVPLPSTRPRIRKAPG